MSSQQRSVLCLSLRFHGAGCLFFALHFVGWRAHCGQSTIFDASQTWTILQRNGTNRLGLTERVAIAARHELCLGDPVWSKNPIRGISCCFHQLTGVPYLRPGPRRSTSSADPRYSNANIINPYSNWPGPPAACAAIAQPPDSSACWQIWAAPGRVARITSGCAGWIGAGRCG